MVLERAAEVLRNGGSYEFSPIRLLDFNATTVEIILQLRKLSQCFSLNPGHDFGLSPHASPTFIVVLFDFRRAFIPDSATGPVNYNPFTRDTEDRNKLMLLWMNFGWE